MKVFILPANGINTKEVRLRETGFSMNGKRAFYVVDVDNNVIPSPLVYFSDYTIKNKLIEI
jgi:hypothetical protein